MQKVFTLRLSPELFQKLASLAKVDQRSISGQLRWLISKAVQQKGILEAAQESEENNPDFQMKMMD